MTKPINKEDRLNIARATFLKTAEHTEFSKIGEGDEYYVLLEVCAVRCGVTVKELLKYMTEYEVIEHFKTEEVQNG